MDLWLDTAIEINDPKKPRYQILLYTDSFSKSYAFVEQAVLSKMKNYFSSHYMELIEAFWEKFINKQIEGSASIKQALSHVKRYMLEGIRFKEACSCCAMS